MGVLLFDGRARLAFLVGSTGVSERDGEEGPGKEFFARLAATR
jgi:hypothetical protein